MWVFIRNKSICNIIGKTELRFQPKKEPGSWVGESTFPWFIGGSLCRKCLSLNSDLTYDKQPNVWVGDF